MKLGVVSSALLHLDVDAGLDLLGELGCDCVEIACGGYHENLAYGDPRRLARDDEARERWLDAIRGRGLEISALALHGAPLSPDSRRAADYDEQLRAACELAEQSGVTRLTLFAGLPEGAPGDRTPVWIASAWPPANADVLRYQWEERLIPYWQEHAAIAAAHGVRLCFEMHPSDLLHNPRALLRLRAAVGDTIGCNFDPSHLFWQGIDPLEAIRALGPAIYHVHAKDTKVEAPIARVHGVLDPTPFEQLGERGWNFRTVGYGHGEEFWADFVSALRVVGYDDVVSIEHEDQFMDLTEGLTKAAALLQRVLLRQPAGLSSFDLAALGGGAAT
jgi:sugar phosphate isomerase/epimerase